jgi:thiol:disulfide interchange protein
MKIKSVVLYTVVLAALSLGFSQDDATSKEIEWQSYQDGMSRGKFEKKKIFLHFYAEWCSACKTMAENTFKDPGVVNSLNNNFIPIRVNVDRQKQTSDMYRVQVLPDTWFISENTDIIGHRTGYIAPEQLNKILKSMLDDGTSP